MGLSKQDVADLLSISVQDVTDLVAAGQLPAPITAGEYDRRACLMRSMRPAVRKAREAFLAAQKSS